MKRGADGKRKAAVTDEEWAEEARYKRELCFFELTDQSPSAYIDPALPLGAAAFNHLAWQCLFSKKWAWVFLTVYAVVAFADALTLMRRRVEEHACPGFDGRKHPERVVGDLWIWLSCVPNMVPHLFTVYGSIYRGFVRRHAGAILWYGFRLPCSIGALMIGLGAVILLAIDPQTDEEKELTCLIYNVSGTMEDRKRDHVMGLLLGSA